MSRIRLTEHQLHRVIKESVKKILRELDWKTYANAARKRGEKINNNEIDGEYGRYDPRHVDDLRTRNFKTAMINKFNDDYGYNAYGQDRNKGEYNMDFIRTGIGEKGYFDKLGTETSTPDTTKPTPHRMRDDFHLNSLDNSKKYSSDNHDAYTNFKKMDDGKYSYTGYEKRNRDAVEPKYNDIPYMSARNKGNEEIQNYQNGNYAYQKGKGWKIKK
jgi:hypothetical protein